MHLLRHGESEFNVVYAKTREDPGIPDPTLTAEGRRQAAAAADRLRSHAPRVIFASPYTRALETADILARRLEISIVIEPLVRERRAFHCDIGTPRRDLAVAWPHLDFDGIAEKWWPEEEETEAGLLARCVRFRRAMAGRSDWRDVVVVTHWGFIRGLTGQRVQNGAIVPFDLA